MWNAFFGCVSLRSIHIPNSVASIQSEAFFGCESLQSVNISSGLRSIGKWAFRGCKSLQLIHIPNTVSEIGWDAFADCDKLEQRQTNKNGTNNYDPNIVTWLRRRFDDLAIHQACYDANHTNDANDNTQSAELVDRLSTLVQDNKQALMATDAMGMTPLHTLCCNPRATVEMIQLIVENDPSLRASTDVTDSTPLQLFLKCRRLLSLGGGQKRSIMSKPMAMPLLHDMLKKGIELENLVILFALNNNSSSSIDNQQIDFSGYDETTNLFPFMSAAVSSACELDVVYALAMRNLENIL